MLLPKVRFRHLSLIAAALLGSLSLSLFNPFSFARILPAIAHEVELSGDVGGTLHVEPNDTPRAGEEVLAWVALTRKGGEPIPLSECDCQLDIYAEPRQEGDAPLLSPELTAVDSKGYQGIPGANFMFPQVGAYTLVMSGEPQQRQAEEGFLPFTLPFEVTVAAGESVPQVPAESTTPLPDPNRQPPTAARRRRLASGAAPKGIAVVVAVIALVFGIRWFVGRSRQKS